MRDSLLGVQLDAKFNEQWGVTAQVVLASSPDEDDVIEPQLKWTLLSYRPTDDWLFRLGRLSLGGLLNQQNIDVGVSYDILRLPSEVYLLSSSYDFDGLSIVKTWNVFDYEITLDGSFGMQNRDYRGYYNGSKKTFFYSGDVIGGGFIATVSDFGRAMYRAGWHITEIKSDDGDAILSQFTFRELGAGFYTLGNPIFISSTTVNTFFLGSRIPLGAFLLSCEGTAIIPQDFDAAPPTYAAYISVSRKWEQWTPYLTYAQSWTDGLDTWRKVQGASNVPQFGITQTLIDDTASAMAIYDQNSWMLGTSYSFTPRQKLKAEVMLTHVGERSAMFDGAASHENVTMFSLAYTFAF
jgi:hypothetical protein